MKKCLLLITALLASCGTMLVAQSGESLAAEGGTQWQPINQLCGQLELAAPTARPLIVGGKRQTQLHTKYLEYATMKLFVASATETECCRGTASAVAQSGRYGSFNINGLKKGKYWLLVQRGHSKYVVPLDITSDFDARTCSDRSVGRSIVVDSSPPKVETRIR